MSSSSLTRCVRKLATAVALHGSRDRRHVDDAGRVARSRLTALCEKRQESNGHVVDSEDICLESVGPCFGLRFPKVLGNRLGGRHVGFPSGRVLCAVIAGDAGVVDEELDALWLFLGEFVDETLDVVLLADVAWEATFVSTVNVIVSRILTQSSAQGPSRAFRWPVSNPSLVVQ
jgi:hypothetical protein